MNRQQGFLLLLLVVTAVASFFVLLPFLQWVLGALLLGYILRPVHARLEPQIGEQVAAFTVIAGAAVAIVLPLSFIGLVVSRDAQALASGNTELNIEAVQTELNNVTGVGFDLVGATSDLGALIIDFFGANAPAIVGYLVDTLLGLTLVLFLVYYVLVDGPEFVQWAVTMAPLDDAVARELVVRTDRMAWSVVAGHIFVALVQGLIGGLGLAIAGIPSVIFWTTVMTVTALLPVIGAFLIWGPAVGYLYLGASDPTAAAFLLVWGLIPVSLVDNYLRSIVIDQSANVNPGVILVGVVGGVYTFGPVGLFIGPLVIGLLAAVVRAIDTHYDR
ncbi:MAG: putative permease, partial [halophilic archaeon J07HX5]